MVGEAIPARIVARKVGAMAAVMPNIKKIVLLMLENRSLDAALGWLYEDVVFTAE